MAQRNLAFVGSGNPGGGATHTVQHTFMLKPSAVSVDLKPAARAAAVVKRFGLDELMIRWNDLPRATKATLYVPEWDADEVLQLALEVWLLISSVAIGFDVPAKSAAGIVRLEMNYGILTGYSDKNSGLPFALVPFLSPILSCIGPSAGLSTLVISLPRWSASQ